MSKIACRDCAFADLLHEGSVECRRFPPSPYFEPTGRVTNIRPRVGQFYWCGEFKVRDDALPDLSGTPEQIIARTKKAARAQSPEGGAE